MFKLLSEKGFRLTFPNGVTLSSHFTSTDLCDNAVDAAAFLAQGRNISCRNCEVAIWDKDGTRLIRDMVKELGISRSVDVHCSDDILGCVSMEDWVRIVNWCAAREV